MEDIINQMIPLMTVYLLQDNRFRLVNPQLSEMLGYTEEELLKTNPMDLVLQEDKAMLEEKMRKVKEDQMQESAQFRVRTKDGKTKWIMVRLVPVQFEGRFAYLGNFMDITEQKRLEAELFNTKTELEHILSTSPVGIAKGENKIIKWVNEEMSRLFGYSVEEFHNMPTRYLYSSEQEYKRVWSIIRAAFRKRRSVSIESRFKRKDGSTFCGILRMSAFDPNAPEKEVIGAVMDISKIKELEKRLAEERQLLDITLRSIGDGVICTDKHGRITIMNSVAQELTGWKEEEAKGRDVKEIFYIVNEKTGQRCEDPVEKVIRTGKIVGLANHTLLISKDGKERLLADSGAPIKDKEGNIYGVVLVFRDVTEERKLQKEIQKMEKLESIGMLAGGIAHDFNNILMGAIGNISLAKMEAEGRLYKRLEETEKSLLRAKTLTNQLLTFSKGGAPIKELSSLTSLIEETAKFCLAGSNIRCKFDISDDLWPAEVDSNQIAQVIANIVINAQQAMPTGGIIEIKAENVFLKEKQLPIAEGDYVKISIQDYGIGVPKKHLNKIFDPFFTTKQKGSGLGLSVAYSIIKNHDGYIHVESELGKGTRFDIYIPALRSTVSEEENNKNGKKEINKRKGRILVMDDEEAVLEVVKEMLKLMGYEVQVAKEGREAIRIYKEAMSKGRPFDLVILDLTVPLGMGGKDTIKELIQIDPDVKAIISTGYSNDRMVSKYWEYGFKEVIIKPYTLSELSNKLKSLGF